MEKDKINPINDFRDAKIGDPVTSIRYGKGFIEEIRPTIVKVKFDTKSSPFSINCYYNRTNVFPDLYKGHGVFDIKFIPDKVGCLQVFGTNGLTKDNYRLYTKFVDLTGKKVISNNDETRLILESNRNGTYTLPEGNYDAQFLFDYYTFEDGTPCGELKEDNV